MMYLKNVTAERIKTERKKLNLNQSQLAEKLNYSKQTIIKWEAGNDENRIPDMETLQTLAELFNCEVGYLLGEYDTHTRIKADIQNETGLSEDAIDVLRDYRSANKQQVSIFGSLFTPGNEVSKHVSNFISFLITNDDFNELIKTMISLADSQNQLNHSGIKIDYEEAEKIFNEIENISGVDDFRDQVTFIEKRDRQFQEFQNFVLSEKLKMITEQFIDSIKNR